ncbi:low temperature requirement protein A, partial [Streptomyces nigra]
DLDDEAFIAACVADLKDVLGHTRPPAALILLALLSYQWFSVYRLDRPELRRTPRRYLIVMVVGIVVMAVSVPLSADARLVVWAVFVVAWCAVECVILISWRRAPSYAVVTEPLVERFGLFIIIVLGEVVIGVVNGLTDTERGALVTTTGLLGLAVGFGFWWNYADLVARRMPRETGHSLATWIFVHPGGARRGRADSRRRELADGWIGGRHARHDRGAAAHPLGLRPPSVPPHVGADGAHHGGRRRPRRWMGPPRPVAPRPGPAPPALRLRGIRLRSLAERGLPDQRAACRLTGMRREVCHRQADRRSVAEQVQHLPHEHHRPWRQPARRG